MLEEFASYNLWIWLAFLDVPGSNNEVNMFNQSPLFTDMLKGGASNENFTVNNAHEYNQGYYLADDIYSRWPVFTKKILLPRTPKYQMFATC
jgi:hypothetical protein